MLQAGQIRHRRHGGHLECERLRPVHEHLPVASFLFSYRDLDVLGAAVAPYGQARRAARGNLVDHAAKLFRAFDALPVDFQHHVVFFQARLGRRAVGNDLSEERAAFFGQLQGFHLVG